MIRTSTLQLAMGQLAEARETLDVLGKMRRLPADRVLLCEIPGELVATGPGEEEEHGATLLRLPVEAAREALRHRLRTLADALAKAGLIFDEAAEELGKPPRSRAAKPLNGRRVKLPLAAPKPEAVA